jgi:hypothetical protein
VRGGHRLAHAPEHVLVVLLSAANRYSVRPRLSTRILPSLEEASSTVDVALAALVEAGVGGLVEPPLGAEPP